MTDANLGHRLRRAEVENPDMPRGLSCLASPEGADGRYETPPASELQRLMWTKAGSSNHLDEVQPRIYIGDMYAAKDKRTLQAHLITHVLNAADGKVFVHCAMGISRSATLVLAFLMIKEGLTLVEALEAVRRHRNILPNAGFLRQLCHLDSNLALQRRT
uniref:Tyrosine specific protein phosphatases domain-containing protein n=1 Tax=Salarias fasciatus TaxID=181472 RepID=A0A672G832_SALFA